MDEWIEELERITDQIRIGIHTVSQDELELFIVRREEIVEKIRQTELTDIIKNKYRDQIAILLQSDELIRNRIADIQSENQQGIAKINQAKMQKSVYDADYAIGGFMFDKRK